MDCEKFETTMIDELYGELDELTSAASKRHVAGCARCSALIGGLRATRRVAMLPVVAPSEGFEERLLAATREAQRAMKPKIGFAQVVSLAGRWAMRPQTAMAAVLLLMVGTSGMVLSRRAAKDSPASASYVVTENGAPDVPAAERGAVGAVVDPTAAAAAHGVPVPPRSVAPSPAASFAAAPPAATSPADPASGSDLDDLGAQRWHSAPSRAAGQSAGGGGYANGPGFAPKAAARMASMDDEARREELKGGLPAAPPPPPAEAAPQSHASQAPAAAAQGLGQLEGKKDGSGGFAQGRSQYAARDYNGAQQTFDGLASQGDVTSALWAARSVRDGSGCALAAPRFDQVASQAWGTSPGYDATLEGGECYRALGQADAARTRFARLLTVPAYASRAQADIDGMSQVAAKAVRRAAPAKPAPPAVAPATSQAESQAPARTDKK